MGSKTTTTTHDVSTNAPPTWAQSGLTQLGDRIAQIIPTMPGPHYNGDFIAQPGDAANALPGRYDQAGAMAASLVPTAQAALTNSQQGPSFDGPSLSAGTQGFSSYNPTAIQPVINSLIDPVMRQLQTQTLPGLQSSLIESGAYGGNRGTGTLPGLAINDAVRNAQQLAIQAGYQDFTDQQNRNLQAYGEGTTRGIDTANVMTQRYGQIPDLLDATMRMQSGSADLYAQGAAIDQQNRQAAIDNQLQQFDYNIRYPYQGLDVASALLGQIANPWGTRTEDGTQTQSTGGLAPILGGIMGVGMAAAGAASGNPFAASSIFKPVGK